MHEPRGGGAQNFNVNNNFNPIDRAPPLCVSALLILKLHKLLRLKRANLLNCSYVGKKLAVLLMFLYLVLLLVSILNCYVKLSQAYVPTVSFWKMLKKCKFHTYLVCPNVYVTKLSYN